MAGVWPRAVGGHCAVGGHACPSVWRCVSVTLCRELGAGCVMPCGALGDGFGEQLGVGCVPVAVCVAAGCSAGPVCTSGWRWSWWVSVLVWDPVVLSQGWAPLPLALVVVCVVCAARRGALGSVCRCVSLRDSAVSQCVTVTVCEPACRSNHLSWVALMWLSFQGP